jgi:hypothetical protein
MTDTEAQLDAEYGESWDPERRALVGPLPAEEAARRHAADQPYAGLLGSAGRSRVLLEVDGLKGDITAWRFDERLRRAFLFEFLMLDLNRMTLLRMAEWQYADADRPEFDATSPRCLTTFGKNGGPVAQAIGASESGFRELDWNDRWADVPTFGAWKPLVAFLLGLPRERKRHRIVDPAAHERPPAERRSGPPQPGPEMVTAFGPPARYALKPDLNGNAREVVVETRPAGVLRMPTGQLVAVDPSWLDNDDLEAIRVDLPRGNHPVTLAVARFVDNPGYDRVVACRVDVRDAPVVAWELALRPGEDPNTLGDDELLGIQGDIGMASFFDAAAVPGLAELTEDWDQPQGLWPELLDTIERDRSAEVEDPATGTNLIVFDIGWAHGTHPIWIGRAADGEVACVVADGEVLSGATWLCPVSDRQNASGGPS